jgi:hypothetical protein
MIRGVFLGGEGSAGPCRKRLEERDETGHNEVGALLVHLATGQAFIARVVCAKNVPTTKIIIPSMDRSSYVSGCIRRNQLSFSFVLPVRPKVTRHVKCHADIFRIGYNEAENATALSSMS